MYGPLCFYGKSPLKGDFIARNLADSIVQRLDDWLHDGIEHAAMTSQRTAQDVVDQMSGWRFFLAPHTLDQAPWMGIICASQDRVGRRFPLIILSACKARSIPQQCLTQERWFSHIEQAVRLAAAQGSHEGVDFDAWWSDLESSVQSQASTPASGTTGNSYTQLSASILSVRLELPTADAAWALSQASQYAALDGQDCVWLQLPNAKTDTSGGAIRLLSARGVLDGALFAELAVPVMGTVPTPAQSPFNGAAVQTENHKAAAAIRLAKLASASMVVQDSLLTTAEPSIDDLWADDVSDAADAMATSSNVTRLPDDSKAESVAAHATLAAIDDEWDDLALEPWAGAETPVLVAAEVVAPSPTPTHQQAAPILSSEAVLATNQPAAWKAQQFIWRHSVGLMQDEIRSDCWLAVFAADMPVVYSVFDRLSLRLSEAWQGAGERLIELETELATTLKLIANTQSAIMGGYDLNVAVIVIENSHLLAFGSGEFCIAAPSVNRVLAAANGAENLVDLGNDLGDFTDLFGSEEKATTDIADNEGQSTEPTNIAKHERSAEILVELHEHYVVFLPQPGKVDNLLKLDWSDLQFNGKDFGSISDKLQRALPEATLEAAWIVCADHE